MVLESNIISREKRRWRLLETTPNNEAFYHGIIAGISIYQNKVIIAHKRKEALTINDTQYYLQTGQERLQEMIDKVCE